MAGRNDAQLTDKSLPPAGANPLPTGCSCGEFQRTQVCDHVLMAAAVRMVRRMIDIHSDSEKPH